MTDHPSALVSAPEPMIEAFRDWYALHFGRPIMKGKARKIVGRMLSAAPAAPQAAGVVTDAMVEATCSRFVSESDDIWSASVWPEGPDDDGDRGDGGRVRLISEDDQHKIRAAMRFALTDALPLRAPSREPEGGAVEGKALTPRQLEAVEEALIFRLAGDTSDSDISTAVYDRALGKISNLSGKLIATREEAPAEASPEAQARDDRPLVDRLDGWSKHHANSTTSRLLKEAAEVLRSQPQAREDAQPVSCQSCGGEVQGWVCQGCGLAFCERDGRLISERPAPDALRVAVEALEPFAKAGELFDTGKYQQHDAAIYSPAAGRDFNIHSGHLLKARQALAALQAEQGAK